MYEEYELALASTLGTIDIEFSDRQWSKAGSSLASRIRAADSYYHYYFY